MPDFFFYRSLVPNFMKIRPVVAEFTHVDGQTDRHDEAYRRFLRLKTGASKILTISEVRLKQTNQV
jgi:hypothetical protein